MINRRGILLHYTELSDYWCDRLINSGLNVVGLHTDGGEYAAKSLDNLLERIKTPEFNALCNKLKTNGIDVEYEAHTLSWMLPRELFAKHPSWFRTDMNGIRTPDFNICISNPEAAARIEDRAEYLASALNQTTNRYYFWSDDIEGDCFCHCSECSDYSPSDQYMLFLNAVLRGIRRVDQSAMLCYLAYFSTMEPPRKVKPENGIFLEYAPINRDQFIPINNFECEQNRRETMSLDELITMFGKENSQLLEYWMDNSRFSNWRTPFRKLQFDAELMRRDLEFYANCGFESITSFGSWLGQEYFDMYGEPPFKEYVEVLNQTTNCK